MHSTALSATGLNASKQKEHFVNKLPIKPPLSATSKEPDSPLLCRKAAARYLGFQPGTLAVWDCTKRHDLKPIRFGRSVRYRKADLDAFMQSLLVRKGGLQ